MMANSNTKNTILQMLLLIGLASTSTAFTVNTPIQAVATPTHNAAAISPLFNAAPLPATVPVPVPVTVNISHRNTQRSLSKMQQRTRLQMTKEENNNEDEAEADAEAIVEVASDGGLGSSSSTTTAAANTTKKKERSGFVTAMVMGPPLIFKFGIVLVVKVLTDLVVFPLLWLYRVCRLIKNKVMGLLPASVSSSINGNGLSDKDIREGKVNGHS